MTCSEGCPTRDHASYAECLRSKGARVAYCNTVNGWDYSKQKAWDRELQTYRDCKAQGIEPARCDGPAIAEAIKKSDEAGVAYNGLRGVSHVSND